MKPKFVVLMVCASVVAGVASYLSLQANDTPEPDIKASYLKGGDFNLSNSGEPFELAALRGKPVILYFGFTSCPDVCPVGLSVIRDALNSDSVLATAAALFVTLDPARDTAQRLNDYVDFFHGNIKGLTGTLEEISAVTKQYGTYFQASKPDASGAYTVDHTAYFYLISKEGKLIRVLDHNTSANHLALELKKLI